VTETTPDLYNLIIAIDEKFINKRFVYQNNIAVSHRILWHIGKLN
jgi:hypothetical protein